MGALDHCRALARRPGVILSGFFAMECPIVIVAEDTAVALEAARV
jgi:hypothetical protein